MTLTGQGYLIHPVACYAAQIPRAKISTGLRIQSLAPAEKSGLTQNKLRSGSRISSRNKPPVDQSWGWCLPALLPKSQKKALGIRSTVCREASSSTISRLLRSRRNRWKKTPSGFLVSDPLGFVTEQNFPHGLLEATRFFIAKYTIELFSKAHGVLL